MILSRKHPLFTKNEDGSGSEQVRYHPPKRTKSFEPLNDEGLFFW